MNVKTGKFDLNMEDVLEAWGPADRARELIANVLDEHALTDTQEPDIYQDDEGRWHIRDFGRGPTCMIQIMYRIVTQRIIS